MVPKEEIERGKIDSESLYSFIKWGHVINNPRSKKGEVKKRTQINKFTVGLNQIKFAASVLGFSRIESSE